MSVPRSKSALGNAVKRAKADGLEPTLDPRVTDARRELAEAKIHAYIAETVAAAPPLTAEQRQRLTALLRPDAATPAARPVARPLGGGDAA